MPANPNKTMTLEILAKYKICCGKIYFPKCKMAILTLPMYNIFGPPHQRNSGIQFKCQFWPLTRGGKIDRDCNLIKLGQYLQFFYKLGKNKPAMLNLDKKTHCSKIIYCKNIWRQKWFLLEVCLPIQQGYLPVQQGFLSQVSILSSQNVANFNLVS